MPEYLKNFDIELTGLDVGLDLKFKAEENVKAFWLKNQVVAKGTLCQWNTGGDLLAMRKHVFRYRYSE